MRAVYILAAALVTAMLAAASPASAEAICTPRIVEDAIEKKVPAVQTDCLASVKGHVPMPEDVNVTAHVAWQAGGAVQSVTTTSSNNTSAAIALDQCVTAKVRAWQLPCGPGKRDVAFTFKH